MDSRGAQLGKNIIDEDPFYNTKNFIFSLLLGLVWQLSTNQAQYNEGCLKLNYRVFHIEMALMNWPWWIKINMTTIMSKHFGTSILMESFAQKWSGSKDFFQLFEMEELWLIKIQIMKFITPKLFKSFFSSELIICLIFMTKKGL